MTDSMPPPSLDVWTDEGGVIVVAGDLDLATGPVLARAFADADPVSTTVVDMSRVGFIDSSGLRTLLVASQKAAERSGPLVIRSPSAAVARLLEITATESRFVVEP